MFIRIIDFLAELQRDVAVSSVKPAKPSIKHLPLDDPQAVIQDAETYQYAILSRATSLLHCKTCGRAGHIEHILLHRCDTTRAPASLKSEVYTTPRKLVISMLVILHAAGKDVASSASDMDDLGAVFSCTCNYPSIAEGWLQMVSIPVYFVSYC